MVRGTGCSIVVARGADERSRGRRTARPAGRTRRGTTPRRARSAARCEQRATSQTGASSDGAGEDAAGAAEIRTTDGGARAGRPDDGMRRLQRAGPSIADVAAHDVVAGAHAAADGGGDR